MDSVVGEFVGKGKSEKGSVEVVRDESRNDEPTPCSSKAAAMAGVGAGCPPGGGGESSVNGNQADILSSLTGTQSQEDHQVSSQVEAQREKDSENPSSSNEVTQAEYHGPRHPRVSEDVPKTFWSDYLDTVENCEFVAPVNVFRYAPFAKTWREFAQIGLKMELCNPTVTCTRPVYWFATIVHTVGYKVIVEFDAIEDETPDSITVRMYVPFCTRIPKPIGYSRENKFLLFPTAEQDRADPTNAFRKALAKIVESGAKTVARDHITIIKNELSESRKRFKLNEMVEALDKTNCSVIRMAKVTALLGDRVHVCYFGLDLHDEGFWFNQHSNNIHKFGFCHAINSHLAWTGIDLVFPKVEDSELLQAPKGIELAVDMVFEMRHPVLPHKIVAAYIVEVYKHGYFKAATDWTKAGEIAEIVLHVTSHYVLPINFCRDYRVDFEAPVPEEMKRNPFSWKDVVTEWPRTTVLNLSAVTRPENPFLVGAKMEAVKVVDSSYMGPATVTKVAGHLLLIHFDGYSRSEDTSYQWVSCESSMIYPVGYAELIGHKLSGKPEEPNIAETRPGIKLKIKKSGGRSDGGSLGGGM